MCGCGSHRASVLADPIEAEQSADQPQNGAQEGECERGLKLGAAGRTVEPNSAPVKDGTVIVS